MTGRGEDLRSNDVTPVFSYEDEERAFKNVFSDLLAHDRGERVERLAHINRCTVCVHGHAATKAYHPTLSISMQSESKSSPVMRRPRGVLTSNEVIVVAFRTGGAMLTARS